MDDYKKLKEASVSNLTGGPWYEIIELSLFVPVIKSSFSKTYCYQVIVTCAARH